MAEVEAEIELPDVEEVADVELEVPDVEEEPEEEEMTQESSPEMEELPEEKEGNESPQESCGSSTTEEYSEFEENLESFAQILQFPLDSLQYIATESETGRLFLDKVMENEVDNSKEREEYLSALAQTTERMNQKLGKLLRCALYRRCALFLDEVG